MSEHSLSAERNTFCGASNSYLLNIDVIPARSPSIDTLEFISERKARTTPMLMILEVILRKWPVTMVELFWFNSNHSMNKCKCSRRYEEKSHDCLVSKTPWMCSDNLRLEIQSKIFLSLIFLSGDLEEVFSAELERIFILIALMKMSDVCAEEKMPLKC